VDERFGGAERGPMNREEAATHRAAPEVSA